MTKDEARRILTRLGTLWRNNDMSLETQNEWMLVLKPLSHEVADRAIDEMRDALMFPPAVADFRSAYYVALALPSEVLALPAGETEEYSPLRDRYGDDVKSWVYCWRCDMALSLEERADAKMSGYDESRGLYHRRCPKNGSAPIITAGERQLRDEYLGRRKIAIGRNVDPFPYRG